MICFYPHIRKEGKGLKRFNKVTDAGNQKAVSFVLNTGQGSRTAAAMKKRYSLIAVVLALLLAGIPFPAAADEGTGLWDGTSTAPYTGTGTEEDPYLIGSAEELADISTQMTANAVSFSGKYFRLTSDIDCNGKQMRIGTSGKKFGGVFDGNGYTIYNNAVTGNVTPNGLFAFLDGATIQNLRFVSCSVTTPYYKAPVGTTDDNGKTTYSYTHSCAGVLAGQASNTTVENCIVETGCSVSAVAQAGGLVGYAKGCKFIRSLNGANVQLVQEIDKQNTCLNFALGGIVGWSAGDNQFDDCGNFGDVDLKLGGVSDTGTVWIVTAGGICGYATNGDSITGCFNNSNVTGEETVGTFSIGEKSYDLRVSVGGILGRARKTPDADVIMTNCAQLGGALRAVAGKTENANVGLICGCINANTGLQAIGCAAVGQGSLKDIGYIAGAWVPDRGTLFSPYEEATQVLAETRQHYAQAWGMAPEFAGVQMKERPEQDGNFAARILLGIDVYENYESVAFIVRLSWQEGEEPKTAEPEMELATTVYTAVLADGACEFALLNGYNAFALCELEGIPADTDVTVSIGATLKAVGEGSDVAVPEMTLVFQNGALAPADSAQ